LLGTTFLQAYSVEVRHERRSRVSRLVLLSALIANHRAEWVLAGCSIEDVPGMSSQGRYELSLAADRVGAAAEGLPIASFSGSYTHRG